MSVLPDPVPPGLRTQAELDALLADLAPVVARVDGYLTRKEIYILALLASVPTSPGSILEIGSFKGKSTVLIARALRAIGGVGLHAIDPFLSAPTPGQPLAVDESTYRTFLANLDAAGVRELVTIHKERSEDAAASWREPLRFLWIDGDHSYEGARRDFEAFSPHLAPGGVVAFHDVLHTFEGPSQIFANRVLLDPGFGACGLCGSIGWAQRVHDVAEAHRHRDLKLRLYRRVSRFAECAALGGRVSGWNKIVYQIRRALVPHGLPSVESFRALTRPT